MNAHGPKTKTKTIAKGSPASAMVKTRWRMVKARWEVLKVRRTLGALKRDGVRLLKLHPLPALFGAFAAGMVVMKLARHA